MKKSAVILVAIVFGTLSMSFASGPGPKDSQLAKMRKEVYEKVSYPNIASENFIEGEVYLTFKVGKDGEVLVQESNSLQRDLEKGIRKQLENVKISKDYYDKDEVYLIKFKFELN